MVCHTQIIMLYTKMSQKSYNISIYACFPKNLKLMPYSPDQDLLNYYFTSKDKNWNQHGIKVLVKRGFQMVEHDGLYFECKAAFVITWRIKQRSYQNIVKLLTHPNIYMLWYGSYHLTSGSPDV